MQKLKSVLENEMQKFLWDFEIQTDHLISNQQPNLVRVNKKPSEPVEKWTLSSQQTTE